MPILSAIFSDGQSHQLAEAPAFSLLASGAVFAVAHDDSRRQVVSFRPGMARIGRPDIKDGAWYYGSRKLLELEIATTGAEGVLDFYIDGSAVKGFRQQGTRRLELGSMEFSRPYLWDIERSAAVAEVHPYDDADPLGPGRWLAPWTDTNAIFEGEELMLATPLLLPPSWSPKVTKRLRSSAIAS